MDKGIDIAQLDFDRRPDIVKPDDLTEFIHNRQPALNPTKMVIGHLQYK
jgi:hypothetical protein